MAAINAPGISAASFSFIFIYINPAVVKTFLKKSQVLFAHRCKTCFYNVFGFFKGIMTVCFCHHRHIQVIHVKFFYAQEFFPQRSISVEQWETFSHRCHQIVIYRLRNFIPGKACLTAGSIISGLCIEYSLFYIGTKSCR